MERKIGNYRIRIGKDYAITNTMPKIYNAQGEPMDTYFIKNRHSQHAPYGHEGKYFLWDRYNYGLDTHFYGATEMCLQMGKPVTKYGMLTESRVIVPKDYEVFQKHPGMEKEFKYVFTYDDRILDALPNARFYPIAAGIWNQNPKENLIDRKEKDISILCSDKVLCPLHKFRLELARRCRKDELADTFGKFDGGAYVKSVDETLDDYRYSIVIENDQSDYYFSERLTSCFMAQTVPVYLGARKIADFFNPDGIIQLQDTDVEHAVQLIKQCGREDYEARREAIMDNYNRVQEYVNMQDYLYEHYLRPGN